MWRYFRNMTLPDSLQEKISAWLTRGHLIRYEFGVFMPPSWVAVLLGQNLIPRGHDPRVDRLPASDLIEQAAALRNQVRAAVAAAPRHADYIQQFGAGSMSAPLTARAG